MEAGDVCGKVSITLRRLPAIISLVADIERSTPVELAAFRLDPVVRRLNNGSRA
jgi:hypothetical protein